MPELRQDPITGRWVIIAPGRASRPRQIAAPTASTPADCPFCTGNEAMTPPEVWALRDPNSDANGPGWKVRVVANKYPALACSSDAPDRSDALYRSTAALGVHEVIIESPDHVVRPSALDTGQFENIFQAYRARWLAHTKERRWSYTMIYKNQGDRAGATLEHVHSQLVALPQVPPQVADELGRSSDHFTTTGRCIYCEIVRRELEHGERLVAKSDRFVALCPYAPRFAFETWILPRHHAAEFQKTSDRDLAQLAEAVRELILALDRLFDNAPFNYILHSAPAGHRAVPYYHWRLDILPQLTRAAGFEWGSGMHMNSVAPEEAARLLRGAAVQAL